MLYTTIALIPSRLSIPVVPTIVLLFAFMLIIGISIDILSAEAGVKSPAQPLQDPRSYIRFSTYD